MADYNLGTAHGRIVVEYDDRGAGKAKQDFDDVGRKAGLLSNLLSNLRSRWSGDSSGISGDTARVTASFNLMGAQINSASQQAGLATTSLWEKLHKLATGWRTDSGSITSDATAILTKFNVLTAGLGLLVAMTSRFGFGMLGLRSASSIMGNLGILMGKLPAGTNGFPTIVKRIIQLSAAITLFGNSTKIISGIAARFALLSGLAPHIERFGKSVLNLSSPIQTIRKLAVVIGLFVASEKLVMGLIGAFAKLAGGIGAVGAIIWVVTGLANAISQLSGLVGFLPGAMFAAAASAGVLFLALHGMSAAIKSGGAELAKLPPQARAVATEIRALQKPFEDLKKTVQEKFFAGLAAEIKSIAKVYFPLLKTGLGNIAQQFNFAAKQVTAFLKNKQTIKDFREGFDLTAGVVHNLVVGLNPLLQALRDIGIVGLQALRDLTGGIGTAAQKFADFIAKARDNGQLRAWIDRAVQGFKDLWAIAANLIAVMKELFSGLSGGDGKGFLATIRDATEAMRRFMESASGSRVMQLFADVIDHVGESLKKLGQAFAEKILPVLEKFLPLIQTASTSVVDGLVAAIDTLSKIFSVLATVLGPIAPLLGFILQHMVTTIVIVAGLGLGLKVLGAAALILGNGLAILKVALGAAGLALRLLTGHLTLAEGMVLKAAGAMIKQWVATAVAAARSAVASVAAAARVVAAWLLMATKATAHAIVVAAAWVVTAGKAALTAVAETAAAIGAMIARWVALAAAATANAATTALGWIGIGKSAKTAEKETATAGAGMLKTLAVLAAAFAVGLTLKTHFDPIPEGARDTTIAQRGADAANTAGQVLTLDVGGLFDKIKRDIHDFPQQWSDMIDRIEGFWKGFDDWRAKAAANIRAWLGNLAQSIGSWASGVWASISGWFSRLPGAVAGWFHSIWMNVTTWLEHTRLDIGAKLSGIWTGFTTWLGGLPAAIGGWFHGIWLTATTWLEQTRLDIGAKISSIWSDFTTWLGGLPAAVGGWFQGLWSTATGWIEQTRLDIGAKISGIVSGIGNWFSQLPGLAAQWFSSMFSSISGKVGEIMGFISSIPGKILGFLGNLGGLLWNAGASIINGLLSGIKSAAQAVWDFVSGIAGKIASLKGPLPYDRTLLIPHGLAIMMGLVEGMKRGMPHLERQIRDIIDRISGADGRFGVNLNAVAGTATTTATAAATIPIAVWDPTTRPSGPGVNEQGAAVFTGPVSVTIDAATVAEMQSVSEFFGAVEQRARAGKATV